MDAKQKTKKISRKVAKSAKAQREDRQSAYAKPTARQAADEHRYTEMGERDLIRKTCPERLGKLDTGRR
jgi:hypothetical protein